MTLCLYRSELLVGKIVDYFAVAPCKAKFWQFASNMWEGEDVSESNMKVWARKAASEYAADL